MARTVLALKKTNGEPRTGVVVEAYAWQAGSPYYDSGQLYGQFTEIPNLGLYMINVTTTVRATLLFDSVVSEAHTGLLLLGDLGGGFIPAGEVGTAELEDGSVTPAKTTFAEDYEES